MRKIFFTISTFLLPLLATSQTKGEEPAIDTSFTDYDLLFNELDLFLDSMITPRNFAVLNLGVTQGYFNYESGDSWALTPSRKIVYSPSLSYYTRMGIGVSGTASLLHDGEKMNPFQYNATLSYDYLRNRNFITGLSFTRFFVKDDLPFYTSPLQNGAYAYFTYRDFWIKPTVAASYGWGSRTAYTERKERIHAFRLKRNGYTQVNTEETVNDFNLTMSVRHDFYWLNVLSSKDFVRITPQFSFISGTQKFGLNQNSSTYAIGKGSGANVLYNSEDVYLDDKMHFQPLSVSGFLRAEYSYGKLFFQPQVMVDYYIPAGTGKLSTVFMLNAGVIF